MLWENERKQQEMVSMRIFHRKVRDGLLEIIDALQSKNVGKAREVLGRLNTLPEG